MTALKKLGKQTSQYFIGEVALMIAGLISFPILTRLLTTEEYGLMCLVTTTLGIANIVISAGLRPSLIRFYAEHKNNPDKAGTVAQLYGTMLMVTLALGLIGSGLLFSGKFVLSPFLQESKILPLLSFASVLVLFQVSSPLILNAFRAEEKPLWYCSTNIINKYLGLVLGLLFLFITSWRLYGFYTGIILGEGIIFLFLISVWLYRYGAKIFQFSKPIFLKTFKYGFPLLGLNISGFITNNGDRYLIQYFLGTEKVAVYSVGYSLCTYVQNLLVTPINMALIPICMNLWESKKTEETKQFLSRFIAYFAMVSIPLVFGLSAVGKEAIVLLASSKYTDAAVVVPTVTAGVILSGIYFPILAGLFLEKRTGWVAILMFLSALSNIILNIILIPRIGILGAAWATLLSFLVYIVLGRIVSYKYLAPTIPYGAMLKYLLFSIIMFLAIKIVSFDSLPNIISLILKVSVGVIIYSVLLFSFDKEARHVLKTTRLYMAERIPFLTFLKPSAEKP